MKGKEEVDILEVRYDYRGEYLCSYGETSKFFREVLLNCFLHNVVAKERRLGVVKTGTRVKVAWKEKREGKVSDFYFVPESSQA